MAGRAGTISQYVKIPSKITSLQTIWDQTATCEPGTWLVLDVDETLLRSPTHYGSEAWYYEQVDKHEKSGLTEHDATLAANADWEKSQTDDTMVAVEQSAGPGLSQWQKRHVAMGLTARSTRVAALSHRQLTKEFLNVRGVPNVADFKLDADTHYFEGVLYVGPVGNKGQSLSRFIQTLETKPKHVIFVDDREGHLKTVTAELKALGISCEVALFLHPKR